MRSTLRTAVIGGFMLGQFIFNVAYFIANKEPSLITGYIYFASIIGFIASSGYDAFTGTKKDLGKFPGWFFNLATGFAVVLIFFLMGLYLRT